MDDVFSLADNSTSYEEPYSSSASSSGYELAYEYESYESKYKYDYTVLAVALITLGFVLPVELARHKIDHHAVGRPFAKTVLEFLYSERE